MVLILVCIAAPAQAYIDPGTGGVVFSTLAYIVSAGAVALGFLFRPLKRLISSIMNRFKSNKNN